MLISFSGVSRSYGDWPAVENVTLEVESGEFVVISGPSGAGKTTLLRLIWMGDLPSRGVAEVAGFRSDRMHASDFPALRRNLGIVFQDFRLLDERSVYENVALPLQDSIVIEGRIIVCLASSWDYDPTSKHQIMKILSRRNEIVWINTSANTRTGSTLNS